MTRSQTRPQEISPAIDMHVHIWPRGLVHPAQRRKTPLEASRDDLELAMAEVGVRAAVASPAGVHLDNDDLLETAGTSSGRVIPVIAVDPSERSAIDVLQRSRQAGAIGVQVLAPADGGGIRPDTNLGAVLDAAAAQGMFVQWSIRLKDTAILGWAASRRDPAGIVINHLGLPDSFGVDEVRQFRDLAALPRSIVKVSGAYALSRDPYPYLDLWPWVEVAVDSFGADRMVWGSDWPLCLESTTYRNEAAFLDALTFLEPGQRSAIRMETATVLLGLDQTRGRAQEGAAISSKDGPVRG